MRRIAALALVLLAGTGAAFTATATGDDSHTYFIELDNAFGLVDGSEVKVAGVNQGTVEKLFINSDKRAVLKVTLSGPLSQLGEDTVCSSEPQSLIAEYFIDCQPKGDPLVENEGEDEARVEEPDIPVEQTRQTVQQDLVQSALRAPFKERLTLIINEFGTALAGNPENLNDAIRRGAPALTAARKVTGVLADQNEIIRDLNADSDQIIGKLNERREDVVRFIENARATADASAERRDDLSQSFEKLDDFLAELEPTMVELNNLAVTQTPLLQDLRLSGPDLNTLSRNLPEFNSAGTRSLKSLGKASVAGERALRKGDNEIKQLAKSSTKAFSVADNLAKFLQDIDDPRRAIEIDARAGEVTNRSSSEPGTKDTMGYTGLEGLLNYVYYQTGAVSQYDAISHLLHFSIFEVGSGPCEAYNAGPTVPSEDGGETTVAAEANRCVAWLGESQPGINQGPELPPYDPSVCPEGSDEPEICAPSGAPSATETASLANASGGPADAGDTVTEAGPETGETGTGDAGSGDTGTGDAGSGLPGLPDLDGSGGGKAGGDVRDGLPGLDDILGAPKGGASGLGGLGLRRSGSGSGDNAAATGDLLGYLFAD